MAKPKSQRLIALEQEWARRHGGPPPITTGAALLAKILRETAAEKKA
jgi:hypothetical protein